jgi:hypothetical protein
MITQKDVKIEGRECYAKFYSGENEFEGQVFIQADMEYEGKRYGFNLVLDQKKIGELKQFLKDK